MGLISQILSCLRIFLLLGVVSTLSFLLIGCCQEGEQPQASNIANTNSSASVAEVSAANSPTNDQGVLTQPSGEKKSLLGGLFKKKDGDSPGTEPKKKGGLFGLFKKKDPEASGEDSSLAQSFLKGGNQEKKSTGGSFLSGLSNLGGLKSSSCDAQIQAAKSSGTNHMLISFEGLASKGAGFVRNNIVKRAQSDVGSGFVSQNYAYTQASQASECAQRFHQETGGKISVVGHSFGGGIASFDFANDLNSRGVPIENAVTLDPRNWTNDSNFRTTGNFNQYQKPTNVRNFTNYYQSGALRGYGVQGANNIEIQGTSHTGLARDEAVYSNIRKILAGN